MENGRRVSEEPGGGVATWSARDAAFWCAGADGVPCRRPWGGGTPPCGHQQSGAGHAGAVGAPLPTLPLVNLFSSLCSNGREAQPVSLLRWLLGGDVCLGN